MFDLFTQMRSIFYTVQQSYDYKTYFYV